MAAGSLETTRQGDLSRWPRVVATVLATWILSCGTEGRPASRPPRALHTPVTTAPSAPPVAAPSPVSVMFVDLHEGTAFYSTAPARDSAVSVALGRAHVRDMPAELEEGDLFFSNRDFMMSGSATIVLATLPRAAHTTERPSSFRVPRTESPTVAFAAGALRAHLDLDPERAPVKVPFYMGRLEGSAAIGEHVHDVSWEVWAVLEAAGTFTLDGVPRPLRARDVIEIPPGHRHSWAPDPGTSLRAVEVYFPPGPEQRGVSPARLQSPP